jgi:hypothetical protein
LNIQEAHAFSTVDGYSLDVFVVDGWPYEVLAIHTFYYIRLPLIRNIFEIHNELDRLTDCSYNFQETEQLRDALAKEVSKIEVIP